MDRSHSINANYHKAAPMTSFSDWTIVVVRVVGMAPLWLVLLLGAALCVRNASQQPRRAVLAGIALGIIALHYLFSLLFLGLLWQFVMEQTSSNELAMSITSSLPFAVGLLLLIWAVFYGDGRPAAAPTDRAY